MSRYIDYDAIDYKHYQLHDKSEEFLNGVVYMAERIEEAPSIDIVRCAECKHKQQCHKAVEHTTHELTSVTIAYRPIDFCSYGEREGE